MKGTLAIIMSEESTPEMRPKVRMVFFMGLSCRARFRRSRPRRDAAIFPKSKLRLRRHFNAEDGPLVVILLGDFWWMDAKSCFLATPSILTWPHCASLSLLFPTFSPF